jgi:hypothetical protein
LRAKVWRHRSKFAGSTADTPRCARRRRVAWLAATALLFQLFVTQVHAFMGGEIWAPATGAAATGQPADGAPVICHYDPGAPAAPSDHSTAQHPECPIYQSLPMVAAALAPGLVELPAPPSLPVLAEILPAPARPRAAALDLRPEPRAPPVPA